MNTYENWYQFEQDLVPRIQGESVFSIQLSITSYRRSPYIQGSTDGDGRLILEVASNAVVEPSYSHQQMAILRGLGWLSPQDLNQPNFHRSVPNGLSRVDEVARHFADVLQVALGVAPSEIMRLT